jgi:hypothetical protein
MKRRCGVVALGTVVFALLWPLSVVACPLCKTGTGVQVRAGLFDGRFGYNLAAVLLPFPIFLGIVGLLYFGPPKRKRFDAADPGEAEPVRK